MPTLKSRKPVVQSVTDLPPAPDAERHSRMLWYSIAMGIRMICILAIFLFPNPIVIALCAAGAIFLPWFAVVNANAPKNGEATRRVSAHEGALQRAEPLDPQ